MLHIAIVDDDAAQREHLRLMLERYQTEHPYEWMVSDFSDGADLLEHYVNQYTIILLDIKMGILDGLETARRIRLQDPDVILFFITSYAQHATEGYDVDAKGFLVKPVTYPLLSRQLDRAMLALEQQSEQYLILNNSRQMQRVPLKSILYIEGVGHYAYIYTEQGRLMELISMKALEEQLKDAPLFPVQPQPDCQSGAGGVRSAVSGNSGWEGADGKPFPEKGLYGGAQPIHCRYGQIRRYSLAGALVYERQSLIRPACHPAPAHRAV